MVNHQWTRQTKDLNVCEPETERFGERAKRLSRKGKEVYNNLRTTGILSK